MSTMLPLVLILLGLGSYCNTAPTGHLSSLISESLALVVKIEQSQERVKTPRDIMEKKCILTSLNTSIESISTNISIQDKIPLESLLQNLKSIQEELKRNPSLKEDVPACKPTKQNFDSFKDKLKTFLAFLNTNIRELV